MGMDGGKIESVGTNDFNVNQLDWFELIQSPWKQALSRVMKQIIVHLKPADRIALLYLIITFPICFYANDVSSMIWSGIFFRLFLIPFVIYFRSFCIYTTSSLGKTSSWYRLKLKGKLIKYVTHIMGTQKRHPEGEDTMEISLGWVEIVYLALDWYVALLFITLYTETGQLIENLHGPWRYDNQLQQFEEEIFHGQPSTGLREWYPSLNSRILGEYLHFCYFMYYILIVGVSATLFFTRPREHFDACIASLALGFFTCFAFYLIYPVEGPYWKFSRPEPESVSYFFCYVVRFILMGSAKGTAMPSGHCAISTICWVSAWRYHLPLAIVYIFFVPGLIFATVWCGFHYGLDAGSGTLWGILCGVGGIMLAKHIPYIRPYHDRENYGDRGKVIQKTKEHQMKFI